MNTRGFALAELLVALAVLGLMLAAIFTLQQEGQDAYLYGSARVEVQQNARVALHRMIRELRVARAVTAVGAGCNNAATGATDITFEVFDEALDTWVPVRYQLVGGDLRRTYNNGGAEVVIGGVQTLRIVCFRQDNNLTATASEVRSVRVSIRTQPEDGSPSYSISHREAVAESQARLRNI